MALPDAFNMANGNTEQTLRGAVSKEPASTKQGILQRLFAVWFDAFVYNQIWEDPAVDLKALQLDSDSRVLTISSGGCNALNYLLENPSSVTAVDLNKNHIFLLNLKRAAIAHLPGYKEFFDFFGFGVGEQTVSNYKTFIAQNLDTETRTFWESGQLFGRLSGQKRIDYFQNGGLYEHSRNGIFLRAFHRLAKMSGCRPDSVLGAESIEEQIRLYEKHTEPFFDSLLIKIVSRMPITLFGLGIPPQQFSELKKDLDGNDGIVDIYRRRAKKLAVGYPIAENYFAWQAFGRKYDTEKRLALPEYLKEANFETLKKRISKLTTVVRSVTDEIQLGENRAYNRFVLLDAQDWMDRAGMTELWSLIAEKAEPGTRIIFRTAGRRSPLEERLPADLLSRFLYLKEESQTLFEQDRASIYGGFHLYIRK